MQQEEIHPFNYFAPKDSNSLIIGTFPPTTRNWSYEFFYPNKQNLFWTIMSKIAAVELKHFSGSEAVEERKKILAMLHVAITDMGQKIIRNNNSSLDENIVAISYMDIFKILDTIPTITKLIFTSSSGRVSAAGWFNQYLKSNGIIHRFPKTARPVRSVFEYKGRPISLSVLYSPSRRAANRISIEKLIELYRNEIIPAVSQ